MVLEAVLPENGGKDLEYEDQKESVKAERAPRLLPQLEMVMLDYTVERLEVIICWCDISDVALK
jgi:hypothetical protein